MRSLFWQSVTGGMGEGLPVAETLSRADVGGWMSREANRKSQELPNSPITIDIHLGRVFRAGGKPGEPPGGHLGDHPGLCQKT